MNLWDEQLEKIEKLPPSSEKTKLIEEMFHCTIWNQFNTDQKIKLMELLEIDLAHQDNRKPNKIQVWQKLPSKASAAFPASNAIRISKHHLESIGIGSNVLFTVRLYMNMNTLLNIMIPLVIKKILLQRK